MRKYVNGKALISMFYDTGMDQAQETGKKGEGKTMRIVLASASPRRKELLSRLVADFEVIPAVGEENCTGKGPRELVQELAGRKALEVSRRIASAQETAAERQLLETTRWIASAQETEEYLVIGADTVVAYQGNILGKPRNEKHAEEMLRMLAGNSHEVYTGVAVHGYAGGKPVGAAFAERTDVTFHPMEPHEIQWYIKTGEPMDKAGGYGIQGAGARFVARMEGDYYNVVGLPIAGLYQILKQICPDTIAI